MDSDSLLYPIVLFIIILLVVGFLFYTIFIRIQEPLNAIYKVNAEGACTVPEFVNGRIIACGEAICSVINGVPVCAVCECGEPLIVPKWLKDPSCWFWSPGRPECE